VGTRELSLSRARRQRWLTGLVVGGISVTALAVGLTYWIGASHLSGPGKALPSPAPDVQKQSAGFTFTRSDQGRAVFTVHAARAVSYQQSKSTTLEDVTVEVFGRTGDRGDILRTKRCEYNTLTGDLVGDGPVAIELSAHSSDLPGSGFRGKHRIYLETSKVSFQQDDELAETDEPVKFRMGPASGTALGMVYATREGWLELKRDVAVDLVRGTEKAPQPPVHLTASALRYDKESGKVTLSGPVEVTEELRRGFADRADVQLDAHNHVSQVNLEGHAKAIDNVRGVELSGDRVQGDFDAATGQLRHITAENDVTGQSRGKASIGHLTAQRADMDFGGKPPQPLQGVATGNVVINLESQPVLNVTQKTAGKGPEKKTLTAEEVHFSFRRDTHGLKDAETEGPGTLTVTPADRKSGERVITAGQFLMSFDARSRIESLHGRAPTQVLFRPPANAPAGSTTQQSQADRLDAIFDAGTQTLREVRQTGNFQYRDGDRQASSDEAHYDAQGQTMLLLGHPQVWDASSRIRAQTMTIDLRTNTSTGEGKVQATHLPSPVPGKPAPKTAPAPTNVLADRMVAQRQSQVVRYEGHVRAWQGTDVVESSALDVFRTEKRLSSGSQVVTSFLQPAAMVSGASNSPHPSGEMRPVTIHADFLEYLDQGRRARYRGNVRMVTESTTVKSDRLDVYFSQGDSVEGSQVDHAEADGHVKVTQPGRLGTGDHAEYFAGSGKIVLTGGQPTVVDEEKGSTTGQRLTFYIHDDRLFVDGGDQTPSLSKHRVAR
jgi:lipopolysaccharide export system protein LptA